MLGFFHVFPQSLALGYPSTITINGGVASRNPDRSGGKPAVDVVNHQESPGSVIVGLEYFGIEYSGLHLFVSKKRHG